MIGLPNALTAIHLNIDQLLLDPNNPRFSELGEELNLVPESRFSDEKVQQAAFEKMKSPSFDVAELRDTIRAIGFLPMDRLVVRKWHGKSDSDKYVVIEGNRRLTALKWLLALHEVGKETFDADRLSNFQRLECLELSDSVDQASATLILPGLRHVSGVKEWGPYQKAKAVHALRTSGLSPQEAAQSLGLSTRAANSAYRCFVALENMKGDEEYGEHAEPRLYSYFEEILKRPTVKNWLGWSDEKESFENSDRLREFYSWMLPDAESGESPRLPEAKSVRDLAGIIEDTGALAILRAHEGSLSKAIARYEIDHPEDWLPKVEAAGLALKGLTPDMLRVMDDSTAQKLSGFGERVSQVLADRQKLRS